MRNTIEAGEEMLYSDKEIHFDESLTIEGRAVFENCKIYCCENGNGSSMEIEEDGELEFINCEIIFCGIGVSKRKNYEFCFISSNNGSMKIKDCKLYNLYHFADGSYQELEVTNSEFTNCMSEIFDTDTDYDGTISKYIRNVKDYASSNDVDTALDPFSTMLGQGEYEKLNSEINDEFAKKTSIGTTLSSLLIGESTSILGGFWNEVDAKILVFLIVVVLIRFRPDGLFRKEKR